MIVSETKMAHPNVPQMIVPAKRLSLGVGWLVNEWNDIVEDDVDMVCNSLITVAGLFFSAAPKLLKGLEPDKIEEISVRQS